MGGEAPPNRREEIAPAKRRKQYRTKTKEEKEKAASPKAAGERDSERKAAPPDRSEVEKAPPPKMMEGQRAAPPKRREETDAPPKRRKQHHTNEVRSMGKQHHPMQHHPQREKCESSTTRGGTNTSRYLTTCSNVFEFDFVFLLFIARNQCPFCLCHASVFACSREPPTASSFEHRCTEGVVHRESTSTSGIERDGTFFVAIHGCQDILFEAWEDQVHDTLGVSGLPHSPPSSRCSQEGCSTFLFLLRLKTAASWRMSQKLQHHQC